jgi:HEAT repeat protein
MIGAGPGAVAAEIDILVRRRVPETNPKDSPQILSEPQRELVLAALTRSSESAVRAELKARLDKDPLDEGTRLAAMHALGAVGNARDLLRLAELAPRHAGDDPTLTHESKRTLTSACAAVLRHDPKAWSALSEVLRRVDAEAGRAMLGSVASTREPRALPVLFAAARWQPELGPQAAALAASCGPSTDPVLDHDFTVWIIAALPEARPVYRRSLLQALGTIDDGTNVATLIQSFDDADAGVRDSALWGLRKLSGLGFPAERAPWKAWSASEEAWHRGKRAHLQQELASNSVARISAALHEYSDRRTRRGQLAGDVEKVLERPEPELRVLACAVLGQLGSPVSCEALAEAMRDADASVREAAWQALCKITGKDLPHDAEEARAAMRAS